jgi:hypothetical protein
VVGVEDLAQALQVVGAFGQKVVAVIGDEQRLEAQFLDGDVGLVGAVLAPADGDDDVVVGVGVGIGAVLVDQLLEQVPPLGPVDGLLLVGDAAGRADAVRVEGERRRGDGGIDAAGAVLDGPGMWASPGIWVTAIGAT